MTLRHIDSFGYLPLASTNTDATNLKLDARGYYVTPFSNKTINARFVASGAFGANCLRYEDGGNASNTGDGCEVTYPLSDDQTTLFYGLRWYVETLNTRGSKPVMTFWDLKTNSRMVTVALEEFGVISAYRGRAGASGGYPAGTFLGSTRPGAYQKDEWFYVEVGVSTAGGGGSVQVRVNTEILLDLVSVDIVPDGAGAYFNGFGWGAEGWDTTVPGVGDVYMRLQDLYLCDDQGTVNNTYRGNVRARPMVNASAGASTDFAIAGTQPTNWQASSNQAITDAGGYVYSSTPGDLDLYGHAAILPNTVVVHGVQVTGAYRMDDATQRIARNVIEAGGVQAEGADHYVNQTFTYYSDIFELNPDTGVGWFGVEVNAATAGPKVEA